jgi:hypothetical protein
MIRLGSIGNSSPNSNSSNDSEAPTTPQHATAADARPESVGKTSDRVVSIDFPRQRDLPAAASTPLKESKVTRELMRMSFANRNAVNEEIHGVHSMALTETSELIAGSLASMEQAVAINVQVTQQELFSQQSTVIPAYVEAQRFRAPYIHQLDFRIKFLRAALFDPNKAAERLVGFSQLVRDILGAEALIKVPIQLSHLAFDEHSLLREANFQILPGRDRSGRRIMGIFEDFGPRRPLDAKVRFLMRLWLVRCCHICLLT